LTPQTDLKSRAAELLRQKIALEVERDRATVRLKDLNLELSTTGIEIDLMLKVIAALETLLDREEEGVRMVFQKLGTAGLEATFSDLELKLEVHSEVRSNKVTTSFVLTDDGEPAPLTGGYGGGVLALLGVLLRVATIMAMDLKRILILDETLAHLSLDYIPSASKLLRGLCEDLGFTILMVTHQAEFAGAATRHYEARSTSKGTTVVLLKEGDSFNG